MMNACWQELQVFLSRCYSENKAPELVNLNRISRVLIHIEKHYAEDLTLTSLAKLANMSKSSLLREFRKTTGLTPFDFVIKRRIRASRELLEDKSLKIYEVANSAGFRDSNYFSRKFRETFGLSPKDFRKTLKP
jgi:transcriptional regulator GlxA family with amidase domain